MIYRLDPHTGRTTFEDQGVGRPLRGERLRPRPFLDSVVWRRRSGEDRPTQRSRGGHGRTRTPRYRRGGQHRCRRRRRMAGRRWARLQWMLRREGGPGAAEGHRTGAGRAGSAAVRFGAGFVWATNPDRDTVVQIDPVRLKVINTYDVGSQPRFFAVYAGSVWTLDQGSGTVTRVVIGSGEATSIEAEVIGDGGDLAAGGGWVWARGSGLFSSGSIRAPTRSSRPTDPTPEVERRSSATAPCGSRPTTFRWSGRCPCPRAKWQVANLQAWTPQKRLYASENWTGCSPSSMPRSRSL